MEPVQQRATNKGTGAAFLCGKAERVRIVQPWKEMTWAISSNLWRESVKKMKLGCFQRCPVKSTRDNGHKLKHCMISEHLETHFASESDKALAQIAQRFDRVFLLKELQKLLKHSPGQPGWPYLRRGIGPVTSRGLFQPQQFCHFVILWQCPTWRGHIHREAEGSEEKFYHW